LSHDSVVSRITHDYSAHRHAYAEKWWEVLDPRFSEHEPPFALGPRDRAQVGASAASDVVLRTLGACLVGAFALPLGYNPVALSRSLRDRRFYGELAETRDPGRFFLPPPERVPMLRRSASRPLFRPDDGVCEDVRFESPFVPVNPAERERYLQNRKNHFAHARHWRHHGKPRATVIAIHGFSADLYHLNEWFFSIPWLYASGYDVLLVTLPFHGKRQGGFSPFSGHGFFAGGASRINEAFAQAIHDLRIFLEHLFTEGVPAVGVTGVSLGGLTAALFAAVEDRLSFVIPNVPVVSLADLVLEWEPIGSVLRALLTATGTDIRAARHLLAPSCPLTYAPRLPPERLMIIGGVGDRLAPPKHARLLWEHWGRCRIHWFPGSHLLHLDRGEYFRQMKKFLGEIEFRPEG
jgi:hypothetical protein